MKTKSALSYFGSDSEVAAKLAAELDGCGHVTIPFVGGASIIPHLTCRAILANDRHHAAINFYRHMTNPETRERLIDRCLSTLSHPAELEDAQRALEGAQGSTAAAWAFWAQCWIGRKGKGGTDGVGKKPSVRMTADGGNNASRLRAAASDLAEWAKQFERCEWLCEDFTATIARVKDRPDCGLYCDPPWYHAGRLYTHKFADSDHEQMESMLSQFTHAKVLIRYGDHQAIRSLYSHPRWTIKAATSRDQQNSIKGEIWITRTDIG